MANAEEQSNVARRSNRVYNFTRTRNGTTDVFFPGAGSTLQLTCRGADTLTLRALPPGLLRAGDVVAVELQNVNNARIFKGKVKTVENRQGRGDDCVEDVTVAGPWDDLERIVYRQEWGRNEGDDTVFLSSRAVLGQDYSGNRLGVRDQLLDIFWVAKNSGADMSWAVDPNSQLLPLDEVRDMTCADAIRRVLRFFPDVQTSVLYNVSGSPICCVRRLSASAQHDTSGLKILDRSRRYNATPITCVAIAVEPVTRLTRGSSSASSYAQVYPSGADTDSPNCLHVTLPLAPAASGATYETFKSVTENFPADLNSVAWWKEKHPRLANVAANAITITGATRTATDLPRIAKGSKGEIEAAGLRCAVSRVTCRCKIATDDDEEDEILLSMDFLVTNATTKTYTYQTGSWSEEGETLPDGLAKEIYEQHSRSLVSERMTVAADWGTSPRTGVPIEFRNWGLVDGLPLQEEVVDFDSNTVRLSFGPPPSLGVEDMRNLLNGFRQRGYAHTAPIQRRAAQGEAILDGDGGIPPIASSEWAPGVKSKTTFVGDGRTIRLDAGMLGAGEGMSVRTLTLAGAGANGTNKTLKVLATEDMTIAPSGSGVANAEFFWDGDSNNRLKMRLKKSDGTVVATVDLPLWKQNVVTGSEYSDASHSFSNYPVGGVRTVEDYTPSSTNAEEVFTATPHSAEHSE